MRMCQFNLKEILREDDKTGTKVEGFLTRTVMLLLTVLLKFPLYNHPDLNTPIPPPPPTPPPPLDEDREVVSCKRDVKLEIN